MRYRLGIASMKTTEGFNQFYSRGASLLIMMQIYMTREFLQVLLHAQVAICIA